MAASKSVKYSNYAMQSAQTTESIEFATMFGSNWSQKFNQWLMTYAGTYLFTSFLLLAVFKFVVSTYQFVKTKNKNFSATGTWLASSMQTAFIVGAILGALIAAPTFAVITPALFVVAMGLDTLRNYALLAWNALKWGMLRWSVRKELREDNNFISLKYEALKAKYKANMKQHGIGSLIGTILTAATTIIFLFPHIGLTAVGATTFVVAGVKMTVAGVAGAIAAVSMVVPLLPLVKIGVQYLLEKTRIKQAWRNLFATAPKSEVVLEKHPLLNAKPRFKIENREALAKAMNDDMHFNAFNLRSQFRDMMIDHIEDPQLAKVAIQEMIDKKINQIITDLEKGQRSSLFGEQERPKREQKLHAILILKQFLSPDLYTITQYRRYFKYPERVVNPRFDEVDAVIDYIENQLKGVKKSFWLEESDTQNVINAFKVYAHKFMVNEPREALVM